MTAGRSLQARLADFSFPMYSAWIMSRCQVRPGGPACAALSILISHMIYGIPPAVPRDRAKPL